jgi:hypothetical protein
MRLGIYQNSVDRFGFAIHADSEPTRAYAEFAAGDLRASWTEQEDGGMKLELAGANAAVEEARRMFLARVGNERDASVEGAVMALDTASDGWFFTRLGSNMPGYHVAMAFAFVPLVATIGDHGLIHVPFEMATNRETSASWRIVHHALVRQAAAIVCPHEPTGADACALLASRSGLVDYLVALGDTFSLTDITELASRRQTAPSIVIAAAKGLSGEDRSWLYRIKLSPRGIANQDLLAVTYARAKARHSSGLRGRPIWQPLSQNQLDYHERQIERFAHHLAVLQLCSEFGIGLWSHPMSASDDTLLDESDDEESRDWSVAIPLERDHA